MDFGYNRTWGGGGGLNSIQLEAVVHNNVRKKPFRDSIYALNFSI
jgi:hypothetical protein